MIGQAGGAKLAGRVLVERAAEAFDRAGVHAARAMEQLGTLSRTEMTTTPIDEVHELHRLATGSLNSAFTDAEAGTALLRGVSGDRGLMVAIRDAQLVSSGSRHDYPLTAAWADGRGVIFLSDSKTLSSFGEIDDVAQWSRRVASSLRAASGSARFEP